MRKAQGAEEAGGVRDEGGDEEDLGLGEAADEGVGDFRGSGEGVC